MKRKITLTAIALLLAAVVMGCTTTQQGTVLGGGIGAGTGAIIGHQSGDAGEGALIGGAIGAITGANIMRSTADSMNKRITTAAIITRVITARKDENGCRNTRRSGFTPLRTAQDTKREYSCPDTMNKEMGLQT